MFNDGYGGKPSFYIANIYLTELYIIFSGVWKVHEIVI